MLSLSFLCILLAVVVITSNHSIVAFSPTKVLRHRHTNNLDDTNICNKNVFVGQIFPHIVPFIRGGASTPLSSSVTSEVVVSEENLKILSDRGRKAVENLLGYDADGQRHVLAGWPEPGTEDEGKKKLAEQVCVYIFCASSFDVFPE